MYKKTAFLIKVLCVTSLCIATSGVCGQASRSQGLFEPATTNRATLFSAYANLDQCANGGVGQAPVQCAGSAWQNGNLNKNGAHYLEGESVPYRMVFSSLLPGSPYTVTIEWDTTENSGAKHAIDYLTDYAETETTANPCSDVIDCVLADRKTFAIPMDPKVAMGYDGILGTDDDIVQKAGILSLFGGEISAVSTYTVNGTYLGASQTSIKISFVPSVSNPVLAWGGHISTRMDWGTDNSAIAIDGSPYHMRLLDLNGTGGNQDRSLASDAAIFPGSLSIVKDAAPSSSMSFGFTATGPGMSDFGLLDDGTGVGNTQSFAGLTDFGPANSMTITESAAIGQYNLTSITCVESAAGGSGQQNSTVSLPARSANIILEEGEVVTCTFVNSLVTAAEVSIRGRVFDSNGFPIKATLYLTNAEDGAVVQAGTNPFGFYQFEGLTVGNLYVLHIEAKGYTFVKDNRTITAASDLTDVNFVGQRFSY